MNTAQDKTIAIDLGGSGYELVIHGGRLDPLVKDLELARWLGFGTDYKIRDLISRWSNELGEVFTTAVKTSERGGRPGREYHLTEEQALFIAAKSETPRATQILKAMIAVFMEARRRLAIQDGTATRTTLSCFGHGCTGDLHGKGCPAAGTTIICSYHTGPEAVHVWDQHRAEQQGQRSAQVAEHTAPAIPVPPPLLHSVRSGTIELGGLGFGCALLSDGRAVLLLQDFYAAFGKRAHRGHGDLNKIIARLPAVLLRSGVQPYVARRLPKLLEPIRYLGRAADPDGPHIVGVDPEAVTEVCSAILRGVAAIKIHPTSTKAVSTSVKVLAAIAAKPWAARIEEACGGSTALARPTPTAVASFAPSAPATAADTCAAIADLVVQRLRAQRLPVPIAKRLTEPEHHELRMRLLNIEQLLLEQAARGDEL